MSNPLEVKIGYNGQAAETGVQQFGSMLERLNSIFDEHQKQMQSIAGSMQEMASESQRASKRVKEDWTDAFGSFGSFLKESRDGITSFNAWMETIDRAVGKLKDVYALAKEGAELAESRQQFTALAASYGVYADAVIEASRRATTGQVSDAELIANTMAVMRQNVTRDQNELAKLWEIAEVKSDQFGGTVSENFRKIGDAIASGNGRALISLGLLPDAYGKASSKAALLEKQSVTLSSVLKQFGEDTKTAAGAGDSAADAFNRFETSWKNLKAGVGELLTTVFLPVVVALEKIISTANDAGRALARLRPSNNATNPFLGKNTQELQNLRSQAQQELDAMTPEPVIPGVPPARKNANTSINPGADIGALKSKIALINAALKAEKELSDTIRNNDLWAEGDNWFDGVTNGHNNAKKAAKDHKEAVESLSKAMREAFDSAQKYAEANDAERFKIVMSDLAKQACPFGKSANTRPERPLLCLHPFDGGTPCPAIQYSPPAQPLAFSPRKSNRSSGRGGDQLLSGSDGFPRAFGAMPPNWHC